MLADRNTVEMVAAHWECSTKTVYRRIADGSLPCLRIGGIVRLSREQVEGYETQCTSSGSTQTASTTSSTARGSKDAFQRGRENAGRQKPSSVNTSPVNRIPSHDRQRSAQYLRDTELVYCRACDQNKPYALALTCSCAGSEIFSLSTSHLRPLNATRPNGAPATAVSSEK